jgi:peptidoglycan/xylan/chitin deacetylase (PgdA/CDA1 family)/glycosyltransferase involved in cell wall biosynthesis
MRLSVVVATYNRKTVLERTLPTLFAQAFPPNDLEIIVVVDGSNDGTVDYLRSLHPVSRFSIVEQSNRGLAAARNSGLRVATGDWILFLDDDLLCEPGVFRAHLDAQCGSATSKALVFGPVLPFVTGKRQFASDLAETYYSRFYQNAACEGLSLAAIGRVPPNSSLSRPLLLEMGGFDEQFFRAHEDIELAYRLKPAQVQLCYAPAAITHHLYDKSDAEVGISEASYAARAEIQLCRKHPAYRRNSEIAALNRDGIFRNVALQVIMRSPVSPQGVFTLALWGLNHLRSRANVPALGCRILGFCRASMMLRTARRFAGSWKAFCREFWVRLPVLLYHHIGPVRPGTNPEMTLPPEQFENQLRALQRSGYTGISTADWVAWCTEGKALPQKPILLTFDDAYVDLADYALPLLKRYGFGGTVFVVSGQIGGTNAWDEAHSWGGHRLLNAEQIRYWSCHGVEFGAHSRTHPELPGIPPSLAQDEISGSANDLKALLGTPVGSFAYPYGEYNSFVYQQVAREFPVAFTTEEGLNTLSTDPHVLRRTMVQRGDTKLDFLLRIRYGYSPLMRLRAKLLLRTRVKRMLRFSLIRCLFA